MKINNILAVRNDRLGEFILTMPALKALKQSFPGAKLSLAAAAELSELAGSLDFVDEVIFWENKKHKFWEVIKFSRLLKSKQFDCCIIFNPSKELNIAAFLAGIGLRIGYNHKCAFLLTHRLLDEKHLGERHEVEYNLELASLIGAKTDKPDISLKTSSSLFDSLAAKLALDKHSYIIIHPWTSDRVKQWPLDNFRELAKRLEIESGYKIVIVGGKAELSRDSGIFSSIGGHVVDLTGKTSLMELAALLANCKILISGDSGPVHLAAAVGAKVIALSRNDLPGKTPRRWGPWGERNVVIQRPSLTDITVMEVFNKTMEEI